MEKWKPDEELLKKNRIKRGERAYKEIQKYCNSKGYMFFSDLTEEEFLNTVEYIFNVPGWLIPHDKEADFISDRRAGSYRDKWQDYYLTLGVFYAFEDDGQWYFSVKKNVSRADLNCRFMAV